MMTYEHAARVFHCLGASTEIRWGERLAVDLPVRIHAHDGAPTMGRLRNLSISGALIETDVTLPVRSAVTIAVAAPDARGEQSMTLEAAIVRSEPGAIGVEWRDMACQPLVDLLQHRRAG